MNLSFWLGMVLLVGGVVMYLFSALVNPWAWVIVAIVGAVIAIVGARQTPTKVSAKPKSKNQKKKK